MTIEQEIRQALTSARSRLGKEIATYPSPITDCDAQFNYLLEQRTAIASALTELEKIAATPTDRSRQRRLAELIRHSEYIDNALASRLECSESPA